MRRSLLKVVNPSLRIEWNRRGALQRSGALLRKDAVEGGVTKEGAFNEEGTIACI